MELREIFSFYSPMPGQRPMKITDKIASVWSAEHVSAKIDAVCETLSPLEVQRLFSVYREIEGMAKSGGVSLSQNSSFEQVDERGIILLYAFGLEAADVLLYLPQDLRDMKIEHIAAESGVPSDVVRRVAILGSQGISRLLDA